MNTPVDEGGSGRALLVQSLSVLADDSLWASHVPYCTSFFVRYPNERDHLSILSHHTDGRVHFWAEFSMKYGLNTSSKLSREHCARRYDFNYAFREFFSPPGQLCSSDGFLPPFLCQFPLEIVTRVRLRSRNEVLNTLRAEVYFEMCKFCDSEALTTVQVNILRNVSLTSTEVNSISRPYPGTAQVDRPVSSL